MSFYNNTLPKFDLADELSYESAPPRPPPQQGDSTMDPAIEAVAPPTGRRNRTALQPGPPSLRRQQKQPLIAQPTSNPAETEDEDEPSEDPAATDSDIEVRLVMEGMKSWTKKSPFPDDAEYLFPKETRRRRMEAQRRVRMRELGGGAGGRETVERATGGPAPKGLLPPGLGVLGEPVDGRLGRQGNDEAGVIDKRWCIPCLVNHTDCVYEAGAESCGGCLERKERCLFTPRVEVENEC